MFHFSLFEHQKWKLCALETDLAASKLHANFVFTLLKLLLIIYFMRNDLVEPFVITFLIETTKRIMSMHLSTASFKEYIFKLKDFQPVSFIFHSIHDSFFVCFTLPFPPKSNRFYARHRNFITKEPKMHAAHYTFMKNDST